ncbi:MAG TPA: NAD(P)-dependent oxidoreductase [bacterium]|nr:NAD(P)-dependent oxidoreductase [bacterium]
MRIFLAGASGAIGKRLVPLLVANGHQVVASTRTSAKREALRAAGAEPVVLDVLDRDAVMHAAASARPDVVIHQVTALAGVRSFKDFDKAFALTNALRTDGTTHLIAAAQAAGARRFIAQSYTGWPNIREGGRVKTEDDALDPRPPRTMTGTLDAIRRLEAAVSDLSGITGIVLRYGSLYGPGTSLGIGGEITQMVRHRKFPIVGGGTGVWSFTQIDDAAGAARLAVERGAGGIYNVVDDEPAEVSVWLPALARAIGARPPYRVPAWLVGPIIGEAMLEIMTSVRGSSNAKAKRLLGWQPVYATWRDGFRQGL